MRGSLVCVAGLACLASASTAGAAPREARAARTTRTPAVSASASDPAPAAPSFLERDRASGDLFGVRSALEERGVSFGASVTWDGGGVLRKGLRDRASQRGLVDLNVALDLARLVGIPGATLFGDAYAIFGDDGSRDVGDVQGFDNIAAPGRTQLAELWWEQRLFGDRLRFKIGKIDANSEFAFASVAGDVPHSSPGVSPTIVGIPTYPDPATGALAFAYPVPWLYAGAGVFDGSAADGVPTGRRGPQSLFEDDPERSLFVIGEAGIRWEQAVLGGPGRVALGGFGHSADFERLSGGFANGTSGFFGVAEQRLFANAASEEDPARGISAWLQVGVSDGDVAGIESHVGGGLIWDAPCPARIADTAGLAFSFVDLADTQHAFASNETAYEAFYKLRITPFFAITADLQWIDEPSGDASIDDALVGMFRFELEL